jgi:hypothetical protein
MRRTAATLVSILVFSSVGAGLANASVARVSTVGPEVNQPVARFDLHNASHV